MPAEFLSLFQNEIFLSVLSTLWTVAPVWAPILLAFIFWRTWLVYTFYLAESKHNHILLEVKIPQDISKTPLAMELVLIALYQTAGETTILDMIWLGKRRTWFSLEIVSIEGQIHFFIWTRDFYRNAVEAAIYAQYPEVEIHEVPDYSLAFEYDSKEKIVWGTEFIFTKPDPYPIKTYVDYGLDKPTEKTEQLSDPLATLLEFMGSCRKGGQVWIQILIQSHRHELHKKGTFFGKSDWRDEAFEIVDKILRRDPKTKVPLSKSGEFTFGPVLTDEEKKAAEAIMRSINKQAFNVGIRGIYLAEKDYFSPVFIVGLLSCLRQFSSMELNGFSPEKWHAIFSWPWQFEGLRAPRYSRLLLKYYRLRSYFHPPYKAKPLVLTTEELATLYHFPSKTAATPTFGRIFSRKAEPPTNLPI